MDFHLGEEQEMIRDTARAFFQNEFPLRRVREVEEGGLAEFLPVYRKMGELGFLGIGLPEEYGGSGGTWLDAALFSEEAGRALAPTLHLSSVTLAGRAVLTMGTRDQARDLVPRLLSGQAVVAPAYLEEGRDARDPGLEARAVLRGDRLVLEGRKRFVEGFEIASALLVTAR